jgi:hypothetical protein
MLGWPCGAQELVFTHRLRFLHIAFRSAFPEMHSNNRAYRLRERLAPGDLDVEKKGDWARGISFCLFVMEDAKKGRHLAY